MPGIKVFTPLEKTNAKHSSLMGFTLLEVLVVLIIIGILASLAFPNYLKLKENTLDREAQANLKLIIAAEKIYKMENGIWYFANDYNNDALNSILKLSLPGNSNAGRNWSYLTKDGGGSACEAWACRVLNGIQGTEGWKMFNTDEEPTGRTTCYAP